MTELTKIGRVFGDEPFIITKSPLLKGMGTGMEDGGKMVVGSFQLEVGSFLPFFILTFFFFSFF